MDPSTGTFITMDSYQGSLYDPVTLHKYLYANADPVMNTDPTGYFSLVDCSVAEGIQSTLNTIHNIQSLQNIVKWADAMTTVYDVSQEMMDAFFGNGSVVDMVWAMLGGVVVGAITGKMCNTPMAVVLKPMMALFGLEKQVDEIQKAFKDGNPIEITVQFMQLVSMLFGLTSQCFPGDTIVATEKGMIQISEIEEGDCVWSEDTETGEILLKKVKSVHVSEADVLVELTMENGTQIIATEGHPFFVNDKGWVKTDNLEMGDGLISIDGTIYIISEIEKKYLTQKIKVYNLEIEGSHTYFVSGSLALVHNICGGDSLPETPKSLNQALDELDSSGVRPGQTELHINQLEYVISNIQNNFNYNEATSSVYSEGIDRYLVEGHHTTVAFTMMGKSSTAGMNQISNDPPLAKNVYWSKKWYQFWRKTIKIVED